MRSAIESRTVVPGLTEAEMQQAWGTPNNVNTGVCEDGLVTAVQSRPMQRPSSERGQCCSRQDFANARTAATSIQLTPSQAEEARERIKRMRPC